jgi:hypothetical protein
MGFVAVVVWRSRAVDVNARVGLTCIVGEVGGSNILHDESAARRLMATISICYNPIFIST